MAATLFSSPDWRSIKAFALLVSFLGWGAGELKAAFTDATAESGIDYIHADESDPVEDQAGACAVDLNQDGWTDLIFARYGASVVAYLNQGDGTFRDETAAYGLSGYTSIASIAAGDLDNDGDPDLFMAPSEGPRFFLLINEGDGNFVESAGARGADVPVTVHGHNSRTIGLVDYDRDGYLDIYVSEWGVDSNAEDDRHSVLLRNRGNAAPAFFDNVTTGAGLRQPAIGDRHVGFSSGWADFDGDGWPDLAKVSDFNTSQMFWSNGNGTFSEGTSASGTGQDEFGMGNAIDDFDGDGQLDLFVTSIYDFVSLQVGEQGGLASGNKLYRYRGNRRFSEESAKAGVDKTGWAWAASFFEYDNDSDPDLVVTNGWVIAPGNDPLTTPFVVAETDPTTLLVNDGAGVFSNETESAGITDIGMGRSIIVFDYDRDGDEDLVVTNAFARPIVYRSNASDNGNGWIRLRFVGTESNRDGIGAVVRVTTATGSRVKLYNPTNAYMGQREPVLHFGLGALDAGPVESVEITWPSGIVQSVSGLAANQEHTITENAAVPLAAPEFTAHPTGGNHAKGAMVVLSVEATGNPSPVYLWFKDGTPLPGETRATLRLPNLHPYDAGEYTVTALNPEGTDLSQSANVSVTLDATAHSVARWWNEFMLDGIRTDFPDPTVHSRNLYHVSAAMWDAYWAYETDGGARAESLFHSESPASSHAADQAEAISHAAYTVLTARYAASPGAARSLFGFNWLMEQLGYDPGNRIATGNSAAAVGNRIGLAVLAAGLADGSNEANDYADTSGYESRNGPLRIELPGTTMLSPNHWQPLSFDFSVTQNGIPLGESTQTFLGVNWREVTPFALAKPTPSTISLDPGPPPQLGTATDARFRDAAIQVVAYSAQLDPAENVSIDISPGAHLNNPLGSNSGSGRPLNPFTGEPYPANVVNRADYGRILAEFWADGPDSETPPGHWNTLHNEVTEHPQFERRYLGRGPELDPLAWDIHAYVALNGAMHDSAIAAWTLKRQYDLSRPVSMIRHLAGLGQSSDPAAPAFHPDGIPLVDDLIEIVTTETSAFGQRHAHLADHEGKIALRAWQGEPGDPETESGGVGWIPAEDWLPYQKRTFVSPAFAAYVSGHSTFSRAGAEVMTLLTGSPFFPGGLGEFHFPQHEYLEFENGPSADVTLQWATYADAADQAGISRLWGGIHIAADDLVGRRLGSQIGFDAFLKAHALRNVGAPRPQLVNLSTRTRSGIGDRATIAGFVIADGATERGLLRVIGPELRQFGITAPDTDPRLELFEAGADQAMATNDNWGNSVDVSLIADESINRGAFALTPGGADAALVQSLPSGSYTFVAESGGDPGTVLVEVYANRLVNLSTRTTVGPGATDVAIAGFVISAREPVQVLVRGIGPALAEFGVADVLADPQITLWQRRPDGTSTVVATNNNWQDDDQSSLAIAAGRHAGAFALAAGSADAALLRTLPAGTYSVVLSSADQSVGTGLVEVYLVQ